MKLGLKPIDKMWCAIFVSIILFCISPEVHADWIQGYFAPSAGVDSINRFMVIRDYRDSTRLGFNIVSLGDINEDGCNDIIACRAGYSNIVDDTSLLYLGGRPPSGERTDTFANFNYSLVNLGDLNGDGADDLGRLRFRTEPWRFEAFLGGPLIVDSVWAYFPGVPWLTRGAHVADLDADGNLDLALLNHIDSNSIKIFQVTPNIDTIPQYEIRDTSRNFGDNLTVGDFNGDGIPDLAIAASWNRDVSPPFVKFYWGGPAFDTIPDFIITNPSAQFGVILKPTGDFNGDGYGDILISGGANDPYGVYFGGSSIDDKLDVTLDYEGGPWSYLPFKDAAIGDFNHDGHPDIVTIYQDLTYTGSYFEIFLGGPSADSVAEVHVFGADIGGPLFDMGRGIFSIGDFNGDGVDDFAMPTHTASGCCWRAEINLFAGWNSVITDVDNNDEPALPVGCGLRQNYPNPFNPSTRIPYFTDRPGMVDLRIINPLGQTVKVLIHEYLPAVSNAITWNAMSDASPASSGVYYCRLSLDGVPQHSIKMLFVK